MAVISRSRYTKRILTAINRITIDISTAGVGYMEGDEDSGRGPLVFDENAISILQAVFNGSGEPAAKDCSSKTARVKFMITMQDEKDLRSLGYSQSQIDTLTPQEAEEIIKAHTV